MMKNYEMFFLFNLLNFNVIYGWYQITLLYMYSQMYLIVISNTQLEFLYFGFKFYLLLPLQTLINNSKCFYFTHRTLF